MASIWVLECSLGGAALGDESPVYEAVATSAWARHAWQPRHGLPEEPIIAIVPLADGTLLAGSQTGRCRLDGDRVRLLAAGDPHVAKLDEVPLDPWMAAGRACPSPITSRCRTADGSLFAGYVNGPPSLTRDRKEHRFGSDEGVRIDTSSYVAADAQGRVWLAQNGLLAKYDPKQRRFIARGEIPFGRISFAPARDDGLWIKINSQVYRYREEDGLSLRADNAPHGSTVLYEDSAGRLWVGSDFFGLYLLDDDSFSPVPTDGEGVFAIADDRDGGVWVGTSTAVNRLWPSVIRGIVAKDSGMQLPNSLCEDRDGRIWLATESGRLGRIETRKDGQIFSLLTAADGWSGLAHCVARGADGQIFIGTRTDGIYRYDGNVFEKIESPPGTPPTLEFGEYRMLQLCAAGCGDLWAVTHAGLFRRRDDRWTTAEVTGDRAVDLRLPKAIVEDTAGHVWLAAADGSLCRFPAGGGQDARGEVVDVGPAGGAGVAGLAPAPNGDLWAAVHDGSLLRIRDRSVATVKTEAGLPGSAIVALAADATGLLWCVTNRQIFAVSLAELDAIADGKPRLLHPWVFSGIDEGVVIDPADRPHCQALVARDGKIWITLRRGLAIVDPARLTRPPVPPPVVMEALRIAGRPIAIEPSSSPGSIGRRATLPPDPRGVEIEIASRGLSRPSNARVAYRLDGFDTDWIEGSVDRPIRYERLPAGRYALRLRSTNDRNIWVNGDQSFVINVQPLLWERPWFRAAALTAAAGLAAAVAVGGATLRSRARLARLEQQAALEQQRLRIARDMHDEAGTAATQLALLADMARAMPDDRDRDERLDGMSRIARQLVVSLDEMVWAVNPGNDTLAHLVSYLGQTASETLGRFGIACRVRSDEIPDLPAEAELRRGMLMIGKEAVSNIVEHAEATAVTIDVRARDGRLTITIEDDGNGLMATAKGGPLSSGGNGLGNMQARAADLGGSCRIKPAEPSGTRIVVDVPLSAKPIS